MKGATMKDVLGNGRMVVRWVLSLAAMAILLGVSSGAMAASMVVSGSTTLFQDNFETPLVTNPVFPPEPNSPEVGSWADTLFLTHIETAASQFTDSSSPSPQPSDTPTAAYGGNQFLRIYRTTFSPDISGQFTSSIPTPLSGSTTVTATFAMFIPHSDPDNSAEFAFSGISGSTNYLAAPAWIYLKADGTIAYYNNNTSSFVTILGTDDVNPLTYQTDEWQVWTLNYTLRAGSGNDTYTVSVDGVSSAPTIAMINGTGALDDGSTSLADLDFSAGANNGTFYVDSVPEPASMSLLAAGGVLLLKRRRA